LVLGIIVLFLIVGINPSSAINFIKEYIVTLNNEKTLYVGGNGPGNYISIQAAHFYISGLKNKKKKHLS